MPPISEGATAEFRQEFFAHKEATARWLATAGWRKIPHRNAWEKDRLLVDFSGFVAQCPGWRVYPSSEPKAPTS